MDHRSSSPEPMRLGARRLRLAIPRSKTAPVLVEGREAVKLTIGLVADPPSLDRRSAEDRLNVQQGHLHLDRWGVTR